MEHSKWKAQSEAIATSASFDGMTLDQIYAARGKRPPRYVNGMTRAEIRWCNKCRQFLPNGKFDRPPHEPSSESEVCKDCIVRIAEFKADKVAAKLARDNEIRIVREEKAVAKLKRRLEWSAKMLVASRLTPEEFKARKARNSLRRYTENREQVLAEKNAFNAAHPEVNMFYGAKRRATMCNVPFDIETSDIVIPKVCPALGIPLIKNTGPKAKVKYNSPTLDRAQPKLGYVKGNINVISMRANSMKGQKSLEDLKAFARWILTL